MKIYIVQCSIDKGQTWINCYRPYNLEIMAYEYRGHNREGE